VTIVEGDVLQHPLPAAGFDVVVFVAVLHHLDLERGLRRADELLAPGGELVVVGLAATRTVADWLLSGLQVPLVRLLDVWHRTSSPPFRVRDPDEGLAEVRRTAQRVLPGAHVRRRFLYRYTLRWTKPGGAPA
jgi:SAM-dependent methyltransferase